MKNVRYIALLFFPLLLGTTAISGVIVPPEFKLQKRSLTVCWNSALRPPMTPSSDGYWVPYQNTDQITFVREAVQNVIKTNFSIESVGLEFVGWDLCENTTAPDHILNLKFSLLQRSFFYMGGSAGRIGTDIFDAYNDRYYDLPTMSLDIRGNFQEPEDLTPTFKRALELLALHEFGHVAGLHHESKEWELRLKRRGVPYIRIGIENPHSVMMTSDGFINSETNKWTRVFESDQSSYYEGHRNIRFSTKRIGKSLQNKLYEHSYEALPLLNQTDMTALKCLYVFEGKRRERICGF